MSLTSYRAAPPRVGNWANGEGRIANGDGLRPFAIRPSRFAFSCVEEEPPVLCRPGDDLLSRVLRQSTIGAEAFDGRVRDGIGSYRLARATRPAKSGTEYRGRRTQDGRDPLPVFCRLNEAKLVFARRGGRRRRERRIRSLFSVFG